LSIIEYSPSILFEDNDTWFKGGYIKVDKTKQISPKFFYTHELQYKQKIDIKFCYLFWFSLYEGYHGIEKKYRQGIGA